MFSVLVQVMVLTALLTVETLSLDINIENNTYTNVQASNIYCHSSRINSAKKIICDFRHTAAKLGSPSSILKENSVEQLGGDLNLEIHNCSTLFISAVFYTWRLAFSSLHLAIENVDDVIQEEMPTHLDFGHNSQPSGDFINFSLKNSKMDNIKQHLISDTKALIIEIENCRIGTISTDAFRNVNKLWQLRIMKSNISRIANRAMPDALSIEPPQIVPVHEVTPFIFNETRIETLDSNSLQLRIMEKDEYFNIINSQFLTIAKGGIHITGLGHVLIADSQFHKVENDSIIIRLRGLETESSHMLIAYSTLTLMGLEIFSMDIDNFLLNIQITNGKLYLIRLNFRYPGALSSIIAMDNNTLSHISDHNQKTFAERWTVMCSCHEIGNSLQTLLPNTNDGKEPEEFDNGFFPINQSDYENGKPTETSSLNKVSLDILKELRCYQEGSTSITTNEFHTSYCPDVTTETTEGKNHNGTNFQVPESELSSNNNYNQSMVWYLGATGGCILIVVGILSFLAIFRHKRNSFKIHNKQRTNPSRTNNSKQVGVISEDPICGCEEGEEESQL